MLTLGELGEMGRGSLYYLRNFLGNVKLFQNKMYLEEKSL